MAVKIKGRKMKSVSDARKTSKGGGGENYITFITEDGITVRLLAEPDGWWGFDEHYVEALGGFFPCIEGNCAGCDAGAGASFRYLVPAVNREDDKVIILKVPKSLANDMVAKYDRRHTLLDRDYFFSRVGTGKNNTTYKVDDEDKTRFNASKYELPDLEASLVSAWERVFNTEDDEDDDEDMEETPRRRAKPAPPRRNRRAVQDDDDDDDEDEAPRRAVKRKKSSGSTRSTGRRVRR